MRVIKHAFSPDDNLISRIYVDLSYLFDQFVMLPRGLFVHMSDSSILLCLADYCLLGRVDNGGRTSFS